MDVISLSVYTATLLMLVVSHHLRNDGNQLLLKSTVKSEARAKDSHSGDIFQLQQLAGVKQGPMTQIDSL